MRVFTVVAGVVLAASVSTAAETDSGEAKTMLLCNAAASDFRVAFVAAGAVPQGFPASESFDASVLTKWSKDPAKAEDAMRSGSRVKHLHCGDVTIDVRVGFYNSNPVGELGAADDFAKLTIIRGGNRLEVALVDDPCPDSSIPRAQAARGPNVVKEVRGRMIQKGYELKLFKPICTADGQPTMQHDLEVLDVQTINWP